MAIIHKLPQHVADLIAAGEVVERAASAVKELMENAIDAGAGAITVEIQAGGMRQIRVTDDGCGMAPEDAALAFVRHATSKIQTERDLEAIGTLGFRGEALAAIAAVSRVQLLTRQPGAAEGTRLVLEGGQIVTQEPAGCAEGTTIIVGDLFYNTPARLKFVKTDRAEGAAVSAVVLRCALSHPEVSVRYIKDGKEECRTPGDGQVAACIYSLLGRDFAKGLLPAESRDGDVEVTGFVTSPAAARGNRGYQFFFVNGRFVKSKTLQAALEQAYRNRLFTGRFPGCVLYITLKTSGVDVNVHPTKTEVKFLNERKVFDGVYYATLAALDKEPGPVKLELQKPAASGQKPKADEGFWQKMSAADYRSQTAAPAAGTGTGKGQSPGQVTLRDETQGVYQTAFRLPGAGPKGAPASKPVEKPAPPVGKIGEMLKNSAPGKGGEQPPAAPAADAQPAAQSAPEPASAPPALRLIGEAMDTYILVEQGESLFIIDKHAAHERLIFDRLKRGAEPPMSQLLLAPITGDLGAEDAALLLENAPLLEDLGFEISDFGGGTILVRRVPADIDTADALPLLGEIAGQLRVGGSPENLRDNLMHTMACKAAIKAGRASEPRELLTLAQAVLAGEAKYCPHGRPCAMELTRAQLDKQFCRA